MRFLTLGFFMIIMIFFRSLDYAGNTLKIFFGKCVNTKDIRNLVSPSVSRTNGKMCTSKQMFFFVRSLDNTG
jgi:hypothetical protein